MTPDNAAALAKVLPQATVTVLPDSGHGVAFQHHRLVAEQVRDVLRR